MFPIINIGPLAIQAPGMILLIGMWGGLILAEKYLDRDIIESKKFNNLVFLSLISGIIGARLFYVIQYLEIFIRNPLSILSINPNLLDIWGGIICAILAGLIYGNKNGLKLRNTLDAITPMLAVLLISISLAHLASGSHFGIPTSLPWGIKLWGKTRHPVQIYFIIAETIILFLLWPGRQFITKLQPGVYFLLFILITSAVHLFFSSFHAESSPIIYGFRGEQFIYWIIMAACFYGLKKLGDQSIGQLD
jgi:phosphatidylglycerol:prolipoprotein diacylglycerol transferase